jgi:hypothetical protein
MVRRLALHAGGWRVSISVPTSGEPSELPLSRPRADRHRKRQLEPGPGLGADIQLQG